MPAINDPVIVRNCLWEDILEVKRQFRRFSNHLFKGSIGFANAQGEAGPHQGFVCVWNVNPYGTVGARKA